MAEMLEWRIIGKETNGGKRKEQGEVSGSSPASATHPVLAAPCCPSVYSRFPIVACVISSLPYCLLRGYRQKAAACLAIYDVSALPAAAPACIAAMSVTYTHAYTHANHLAQAFTLVFV
jgi:hypothetical protein